MQAHTDKTQMDEVGSGGVARVVKLTSASDRSTQKLMNSGVVALTDAAVRAASGSTLGSVGSDHSIGLEDDALEEQTYVTLDSLDEFRRQRKVRPLSRFFKRGTSPARLAISLSMSEQDPCGFTISKPHPPRLRAFQAPSASAPRFPRATRLPSAHHSQEGFSPPLSPSVALSGHSVSPSNHLISTLLPAPHLGH